MGLQDGGKAWQWAVLVDDLEQKRPKPWATAGSGTLQSRFVDEFMQMQKRKKQHPVITGP